MQMQRKPSFQAPQIDEGVAVLQREFPCFENGHLILLLDQQRTCWISLPSICNTLGLNNRGQLQRILRTPELVKGLRRFELSTRGGVQQANCLQFDIISDWMETLRVKMAEEYRTLFIQTVREAAKALQTQQDENTRAASPQMSLLEVDEGANVYQLALPFTETTSEEEDAQSSTMQTMVTALPGLGQVKFLMALNHPEDTAIREATLARPVDWQREVVAESPIWQRLYYLASNQVRVLLGDPELPTKLEDVQTALHGLRESTILTARYILGRWHIAREQNQLGREGSVAILPEDILEWRGIQRHSRAFYPGSEGRREDDFDARQLEQVHYDIKLLEIFYLQGFHQIFSGGRLYPVKIDGPYIRSTRIQETNSERELYLVAPGGWIQAYEAQGVLWLAELDRRIFQLHPQQDQLALRIALFLTEHWNMHLAAGIDVVPLSMEELLTASMIPIDRSNLIGRFAPRVEAAIQKLVEQGIIGQAHPGQPLEKKGYWGKTWLATSWEIRPPEEMIQRRKIGPSAAPLLLPGGTLSLGPGKPINEKRKRRKRGEK